MVGRPVAMHAMRGISAHSNGFHTCRNIHVLQMILGAIDTPGSFRYKPPFPRPTPPAIKPAGRAADILQHQARHEHADVSLFVSCFEIYGSVLSFD